MNIESIKVGELKTNVYFIKLNRECLIIDPGDEIDKIMGKLNNYKLVGIIITHYHFDHIGALDTLVKKTGAKVYDYTNLKEGNNKIGSFHFEVIYTPGHKEDSISVYFPNDGILFSGDFIFEGTIGRMDLPGGSSMDMQKSIKKILTFPNDLIIYPGHGNRTTLNSEKGNLENYLNWF